MHFNLCVVKEGNKGINHLVQSKHKKGIKTSEVYIDLFIYRGLTGGFLLLQNFSVAISVSPHVCFILVLILISMFLR